MSPTNPLRALVSSKQLRRYDKGEIILHEGDNPDYVFIIHDGIVKVHDIDKQGNDKILHLLKRSAVFPLNNLLYPEKSTASFYTSITSTEIYAVPYEYAMQQIDSNRRLTTYLLRRFANETHELLVRISSMEKTTVIDRLIAALKFLAVHYSTKGRNGYRRVCFPVSHQLLADLMGVTREITTKAMKALQEQKLIRYPRTTTLEINFEKLVTL